jgi:uncharacterized protein
MIFAQRACRITMTLAAVATFALSGAAFAEDNISESHLKAARAAVDAINATDQYDVILPSAARAIKTELIQKNPDLQDLIIKTVDEQTIKLVARRGDLEREAATAYARVFTEEQLNAIATFYQSEAGLKLLSDGPIVTRELIKSARIWQNGIARDLAVAVGTEIAKNVGKAVPAQGAAPALPAPEGTAPGTEAPAEDSSSN